MSLNNASANFGYGILETDVSENFRSSKLSINELIFSNGPLHPENMTQKILSYASFLNSNMIMLLRSALISNKTSFRRQLHDFRISNKRNFSEEINKWDKHQNTLLWYLTIANRYDFIEELYQLVPVELNINAKNGLLGQTILHYAVIHHNMEAVRMLLNIGVDTNLIDRFGRTPLHYVALYGAKNRNDIEITTVLMHHGALLKYLIT